MQKIVYHLTVNDGLIASPILDKKGSSGFWAAILERGVTAPRAIKRTFYSPKSYQKYPASVFTIGKAIEFCADYTGRNSVRYKNRWCGVVIKAESDYISVRECDTPFGAILYAESMQGRGA